MKKIKLIYSLFFVSLSFAGVFNHIDWGARVVGLGVGYVGGIEADSNMIMWNPSGIVYIKSTNELSGMYGIPFLGLGGIDLRYGMVSFVRKIDKLQTIGIGIGYFDGDNVWREGEYIIGYGRMIKEKISVGVSLKYLEYKINLNAVEYGNDSLVRKGGKGIISGDVGVTYKPLNKIGVGVVLKDILESNIGLEKTEKLELGYILGLNYLGFYKDLRLIYSLGYYGRGKENGYSLAAEAWLKEGKIGIRGSISDVRYALGGSYNLDKIRIDYTYCIPIQITENQGSHYLGVIFRF